MNLLTKLRSWRHYDKVLHAAVGFGLGVAGTLLTDPMIGLLFVAAAGIGKEIYDAENRARHTPDVWDAVVTVAAGFPGVLLGSWLLWVC